jgi:hypothetical protein
MKMDWVRVSLAMAAVMAAAGCGRVEERLAEVEAKKAAEEAVASLRFDETKVAWLGASEGEDRVFDSREWKGRPWLLLAARSDDGACVAAASEEWGLLAREASRVGGAAAVLLLDAEADGDGRATAVPESARAMAGKAGLPVWAGSGGLKEALGRKGAARANPTAYLFGRGGEVLRVRGGHVRIEEHVADLEASAKGEELPVHKAVGVLPEENEP